MLYDPLAVKRLASAVCVLPPTPRSLIGPSGCQGCASSSTTASSREPGLDAGAPGRLYCVPSQEEEQQRPVVGHGIVLEETSSQENLAKGKGRAWGAERSSTEPFRKKDHATYLGAQRPLGGVGGCAHQQPGTRPPSTSGTNPRFSPAGVVPVTPLGDTPLRPYGSSGRAPSRTVAGDSPALGGSPGGGFAAPPSGAGRGGEATRTARRGARQAHQAAPRTGATAGEAAMAPGAPEETWREIGACSRPGRDWPDAPVRCPHAVWASWETPGTARPPAGALPPPAPAGEYAW